MNLQSRSQRWLNVIDIAVLMTGGLRRYFDVEVSGQRRFDPQSQKAVISGLYQLKLTAEADPVSEGEPLYEILGGVIAATENLIEGPDFLQRLERLDSALSTAVVALRERTAENDLYIDDIVSGLERAFLLSLVMTLTSHHSIVDWEDKWQQDHQDFLAGTKPADRPHYVAVAGLLPSAKPGPGRIHVQHLHSAMRAGTLLTVAGVSGRLEVNHYPEYQSIIYSQWFAYMHSIWDEQYRGRIANHFDTPQERIRQRDIVHDFFGDMRLIRNDYVHNKGIVDEAANVRLLDWGFKEGKALDITTQQMLSLIPLFPRDALMVKPTPQPVTKKDRKSAPGSLSPAIREDVLKRTRDLGLDKDEVLDEAFSLWLASKSGQ